MRATPVLTCLVAAVGFSWHGVQALGTGSAISVAAEVAVEAADEPTFLTYAPGDPDRLFFTERDGRIRIIRHGQVVPDPFLDITALVSHNSPTSALAGLAFDPDYQSNGYFYVTYMDLAFDSVLARFCVTGDPEVADPGSLTILLTVEMSEPIHNVGWIAFGPDGYLYVGSGDGEITTFGQFAQDIDSLLGKILRIDVRGPDPYGIPPGNPFVGAPGRDEIWALGLRNPWRCSFDRLTKHLWIGDVGEAGWEEVDLQPAGVGGANYGWNCMEGPACNSPANGCACGAPALAGPLHAYDHLGYADCAIIGGYVYRGSAIPPLEGRYVFGDLCSGSVWAFDLGTAEVSQILQVNGIYSFAEDHQGELYILTPGEVLKMVVADCNDNQIPDAQDIRDGTSADCNANGIPDECEGKADCNGNSVPDSCDIASGTSADNNNNGIPDECDLQADLNGDGIVGVLDLLMLMANWGNCPQPCPPACRPDLDGDCTVGPLDMLVMFESWS